MNINSFLSLTVLIFITHNLYAYRPFATEDAGVAQLCENKIELGYQAAGIHANSIDSNYFEFLVGIGLGKAELMIVSPYCINSNVGGEDKGLQDVGIAAKIRLAGEDNEGVILKTDVYRSDMYSISTAATYSFIWGLLHIQAGWMSNFQNDGFFGGLGFDIKVLDTVGIVIDSFTEHIHDITCYQILAGGIIAIEKDKLIDAAIGYSWVDSFNKVSELIATVGCSFTL
jgi:hypothetical protein